MSILTKYDLNDAQRKALEDIVGARYVSTEPCVRDAYTVYHSSSAINKQDQVYAPRPAAVILPKSTEEVARIVKFCNENDYQAKAFSTGMAVFGCAGSFRTILIDLRRMDKICEFDVKNQMALVEPYVKAAVLQNIAFPYGLNTQILSAGGQHSVLAGVTSSFGFGLLGPSCSTSARNMLGLEWVMPSGEVLTLGSAGDGCGWFTASGPGPNLHGLIRGYCGAFGGAGVYTKCAVKMYKWDGQKDPVKELQYEGESPAYFLKQDLPENVSCLNVIWGTAEGMQEGVRLYGEADIPYSDFKLPAFFTAIYSTKNNLEFLPVWKSGIFQMLFKHAMILTLVGATKEEIEWKEKALRQILKKTGGLILPISDMPPMLMKALQGLLALTGNPAEFVKKAPFVQKIIDKIPVKKDVKRRLVSSLFYLMVRNANNCQGSARASGGGNTGLGSVDGWDTGWVQNKIAARLKSKPIEEGLFVDDGGDLSCGGTYEAGSFAYMETLSSSGIRMNRRLPPVKNIWTSVLARRWTTFCPRA